MNRFLSAAVLAVLVVSVITACSEDQPRLRIRNEHDKKANVQVKPETGSTTNINDVAPGAVTEYRDMNEGRYRIKASIQSGDESNEVTQDFSNDTRYEVIIRNTEPPVLEVVTN